MSPCDQIRFGVLGHDGSISDNPICYDRLTDQIRPPGFEYDLHDWDLQFGTI